MNNLFVGFLIALTVFRSLNIEKYKDPSPKSYCNFRFGYCIQYRDDILEPQEEAQNGDGKVFKDKNGIIILTVYGRFNQDVEGNPISLEKQLRLEVADLGNKKYSISYQKIAKNFYIISGFNKDKIFYHKVILKENAFCFALLEYPKNEKAIYDKYSELVFKSFH